MKGIKYLKIRGKNAASYGWHQLHTGRGFKRGDGVDVRAKYLQIGKIKLLLGLEVTR